MIKLQMNVGCMLLCRLPLPNGVPVNVGVVGVPVNDPVAEREPLIGVFQAPVPVTDV
jgi:hypothetical protein